jgi:hypothetical protein
MSGCSSMSNSPNYFTDYDWANLQKPFIRDARMEGPPQVQNCGIIAISTPTSYEGNGKKYSSIELTDLREGKASTIQPRTSVPRGAIQR